MRAKLWWPVAVLLVAACQRETAPARRLSIAAAANLTDVFADIGKAFESETQIPVVFSYASTAQLTQQIENSAPFDAFAAADTSHIDELDRGGLLLAGSRAIYARGTLALWIPPGSHAAVKAVRDLVGPDVRAIAIARPETAPYGEAAVETLQTLKLWDLLRPKIVYAGNIGMAKQYGASGNVDACFTAYSLVLRERGTVIKVGEELHRPIDQAFGIVKNTPHEAEARGFARFLVSDKAKAIFERYGYR